MGNDGYKPVDKDAEVSVPENLVDEYTLVDAEIWNKDNKTSEPGKWKNYDLFKNNWEHNVFIKIGDNEPIRMLELLSKKDPIIVDLIFKHYKLKIKGEDLVKFANALFEVIVNKKPNVGAKIAENSVRCIP